jgi:3-keto-L-gulonate-6-phosphate decarboxylase
LRAGKDLGIDKIRTIKEQYPDLNMDWVIYDEGEMILNTVAEPTANYENTSVDKSLKQFVFDCIEEYLDTQKKEQS